MSGLLPAGTVTLLMADVEGATRLWETDPERMAAAVARLDHTLAGVAAAHDGVRPVGQREGDGFVVAFSRASDAVACAVDLQRASLAPIRLRIGVHTGEVRLGDEGSYVGATINRAARLRDLAHGGQTVVSGATEQLVADRLPAGVWLIDLGSYVLRGVAHPERVVQLCHRDLDNEFPPLRTPESIVGGDLPVQLTSFVGRQAELAEVRELVGEHRLVTLTGAGGVGKTRLAAQLAGELADGLRDQVWWVDMAPIAEPELVAVAVARTLGLPDQPGLSTRNTLARFIGSRRTLVVLDNCEHLLEACAALVVALLGGCPGLTILATSREPIAVAGEVTWNTPSLSLADEAVELFTDRARLARPGFIVTGASAEVVGEICQRLDGVPLAIELAAARVRALSLTEILDGLRDRFRLLTGAARTAVPRQQTLQASLDWSYALLTESERVLFRRLAVFMGGFDLDAAHAVAGGADLTRYQILDELSLLVDKSLVVADDAGHATRYRLLETIRYYALDRLGESGEADTVRSRHRDHYAALAARVDAPVSVGLAQHIEQAEIEIDNLRAAFAWSRDRGDVESALRLASSLLPLWQRGRILEGLAWFDAVLADSATVTPAARARALADKTLLDALTGAYGHLDQVEPALAIARDLDDPALLVRVLTACAATRIFSAEPALPYFAETVELTRALGDDRQLSWLLGWQAISIYWATGDPVAARAVAEEGYRLAEAIGDGYTSRMCRWSIGTTRWLSADLVGAAAQFSDLAAEAEAAHDPVWRVEGLLGLARTLAHRGDTGGARAAAEAAVDASADLTSFQRALSLGASTDALLAAGDVPAAVAAGEAEWQASQEMQATATANPLARVALAQGDLSAARRWADVAVSAAAGGCRMMFLATRVRVAIAQGDVKQAECDAHDALAIAAETKAHLTIPDVIECLAGLSSDSGAHREAARLFGAAAAIRDRTGQARFKIYDADYEAAVAKLRDAMAEQDFDAGWAEGAALSTDEAISYAQRGRGKRGRPTSGWDSLTPTERDVVRLVSEGLANKDIAARLFVSRRTAEAHVAHIYTKLGLASRVQLVQEAARNTESATVDLR